MMFALDPEFGASVLRLWVAVGSAVLLILFCALAVFLPQLRVQLSPGRRAGLVVAGAILGGVISWAFVDRGGAAERAAERRAYEVRAEQLSALSVAPGSPLACLDALAGDTVEAACEKALFSSPANVAAASSYVAARLTLLSSMAAFAHRSGADMEDQLSPLRRSLEADRFGFVAHVLAVRDGCTGDNCKTLALLHDATRVRNNLGANALDHYVERYAAIWSAAPETPAVADATPQQSAPTHKPVNIDFPTSASIPPVSIMNAEPTGPVLPGAAAAAASNPNPAAAGPQRHARRQAPSPPPAQPAPAPAAGSAAVEPIWPEPVPPIPSSPAANPQSTAAPATPAPAPPAAHPQ